MARPRSTVKIPANHRIFLSNSPVEESDSDTSPMNLSDTVFEFLDDCSPSGSSDGGGGGGEGGSNSFPCLDDDDDDHEPISDDKTFWENQHQLLKATLYRTSSLETKIRKETKEVMEDLKIKGNFCSCGKPVAGGSCRDCLMREVCTRLRNSGFNCAISKSKWRNSADLPSGEHKFLDVIDNSDLKKGEIRVVIELNFRGEFEMSRMGEEYQRLTSKLPEVFVGKVQRLESLIKIICFAGKKCMKEKKMHIGPWRKQKYMQAKWLGPCQRTEPTPPVAQTGWWASREVGRRPVTSMLTVDFLDIAPKLQCQMVFV
ncbi:uncharacterized protein LOC124936473 [Impatiens glandulifera]|uniref:uncharacterized protein LOC124936473 n=1 Tax=Impatiens glandulifera TaxID=253017 RepID=UPI001FB054B7|nr:uncharacterized protein LOC124936473 [Impatiens glandulifera]